MADYFIFDFIYKTRVFYIQRVRFVSNSYSITQVLERSTPLLLFLYMATPFVNLHTGAGSPPIQGVLTLCSCGLRSGDGNLSVLVFDHLYRYPARRVLNSLAPHQLVELF